MNHSSARDQVPMDPQGVRDRLGEIGTLLEGQQADGCDLNYRQFPFKATDLRPTGSISYRDGAVCKFAELHLIEHQMESEATRPSTKREWFIMLNPATGFPEPVSVNIQSGTSLEPAVVMTNGTMNNEPGVTIDKTAKEFQTARFLAGLFLEDALGELTAPGSRDMACRIHDKAGHWAER